MIPNNHVLSDERPSNAPIPSMTASQVSCTTSAAESAVDGDAATVVRSSCRFPSRWVAGAVDSADSVVLVELKNVTKKIANSSGGNASKMLVT